MKNKILLFLLVWIMLFHIVFSEGSLEIYSPNYFNEQKNVYKPIHFLEDEYLSFLFCEDSKYNISNLKITLESDYDLNELKYYKFNNDKIKSNKNCYFSNFLFSQIKGNEIELKIKYEVLGRKREITRKFIKQKESKLINFILNNENNEPIDLVSKLIISNDVYYKDSQESEEYYNKLKNARNNEKKCWGYNKDECSLILTSKILAILKLGGYEENNRLIEDGSYYLNNNLIKQNSDELKIRFILKPYEDDIKINITNNTFTEGEVKCNLTIDNSSKKKYSIKYANVNDSGYYVKEDKFLLTFNLSCNKNLKEIKLEILDDDDEKIYDEFLKNKSSIDYRNIINENTCLGKDNACTLEGTLYSLIGLDGKMNEIKKINLYLDSLINETDNFAYIKSDKNFLETALYTYYKNNKKMMNFLKYFQNNDGSWGDEGREDKVLQTSWSIVSLSKREATEEYINDGKKWVYYNEPEDGWDSIYKNLMAYFAIKEKIKPYIKVSFLDKVSKNVTLKIKNPTIYKLKDLQVDFGNLEDFITFKKDLGDLLNNEEIEINIAPKSNFYGEKTGYLTITGIYGQDNEKKEFLKIPILISSKSPFDIISNNLSFIEGSGKSELELKNVFKTEKVWNCTVNSDLGTQNIILTDSSTKFFLENKNNYIEGNTTLNVICSNNDKIFSISKKVEILNAKKEFSVDKESIIINSTNDFNIKVTNLLKHRIVVESKVDGVGIIEPAEKNKILASGETRDIYFVITNKELLKQFNGTKGKIILSTDNYYKEINFTIDLSNKKEKSNNLKWIIIGIVSTLIIIILIIRYKNLNTADEDEEKNFYEDEEIYIDEFK